MKLIVISSPKTISNEENLFTVLFENGLQTLHLRKPRYSTARLAKLIEKIPAQYHNRIVIHTHHNLLLKYDLKGIHFTKKHKKRRFQTWCMMKLLRSRKSDFITSTSYTKLGSVIESVKEYSYVFLSPIFDSSTSKYQAGFTEHSLKGVLEKTHHRVIARGGIEVNYIPKVMEIGFTGLAVRSDLWDSDDPTGLFIEYVKKFKELGIELE
jgi:thiamine-phosphate pyrophosphorylase